MFLCYCDGYCNPLHNTKEHKNVFIYGTFELLYEEDEKTFVYKKKYGEKVAMVVLNFTTETQPLI